MAENNKNNTTSTDAAVPTEEPKVVEQKTNVFKRFFNKYPKIAKILAFLLGAAVVGGATGALVANRKDQSLPTPSSPEPDAPLHEEFYLSTSDTSSEA